MQQGTRTVFDDIAGAVDEFERALAMYNINVRPGSKLEHACLILKDLKFRRAELLRGKPCAAEFSLLPPRSARRGAR